MNHHDQPLKIATSVLIVSQHLFEARRSTLQCLDRLQVSFSLGYKISARCSDEVILILIMKVILLVAAVLATSNADIVFDNVVVDLDVKENQNLVPRIVNGQAAAEDQFPHQALVFISKLRGTSQCGGTLLSASWVLCAAHCIVK